MANMRRMGILILLVMVFGLTGCAAKAPAEAAVEERTYPEPDTVSDRLEEAGYSVERFDEFEDLGITTNRVKAAYGDDYLDICYNVLSAEDINLIMEYYAEHYQQCSMMSDTDIVYCYSGENVLLVSGLQEQE